MIIGIDVDDTTFNTINPMLKYADLYNKELNNGYQTNSDYGKINNRYYLNALYGWNTEKITKQSLEQAQIPYDNLYLGIKDKLLFCKEHNVDIMIEDSYETCFELEEQGIKSILMTTILNKDINSFNVPRVNNWKEVYELIKNPVIGGDR